MKRAVLGVLLGVGVGMSFLALKEFPDAISRCTEWRLETISPSRTWQATAVSYRCVQLFQSPSESESIDIQYRPIPYELMLNTAADLPSSWPDLTWLDDHRLQITRFALAGVADPGYPQSPFSYRSTTVFDLAAPPTDVLKLP